MDAARVKRIIDRHGGEVFEETADKITAEFMCSLRAADAMNDCGRVLGKFYGIDRKGCRLTVRYGRM